MEDCSRRATFAQGIRAATLLDMVGIEYLLWVLQDDGFDVSVQKDQLFDQLGKVTVIERESKVVGQMALIKSLHIGMCKILALAYLT